MSANASRAELGARRSAPAALPDERPPRRAVARTGVAGRAEQRDRGAGDAVVAVELDGGDGAGEGEVAVAAGELLDAERRMRPVHTGKSIAVEQLVGLRAPSSTRR